MAPVTLWSVLGLAAVASVAPVGADEHGLKNIKHIVLFMQENRAFDHYFGTMAGVRGFQDPNVHISKNTGKSVFHQPLNSSVEKDKPPKGVKELMPWYLNYQGGDWKERTQCMLAGDNSWQPNHAAWNKGEIDQWVLANTPYSIGYYRREDLPIHFGLAGNFTIGDSYYESIIASTDPNRVSWFSGTINLNGSQTGGHHWKKGGAVIDNNRDPTCLNAVDGSPFSCRPLNWKTVPEYLHESGISFRFYQDFDNFECDTLVQWKQYQEAAGNRTEFAHRSVGYPGLDKFYKDAKEGNLPEVSYIIPPEYLSEHPPYRPYDGAWFQRKVAEAIMSGKSWNNTALIVSYDETGGWADHVMAPHPPKDAQGEWMPDPYNKTAGLAPTGPGFRLPFYIVSPWTRNGGVFTEHASHESQILFLEEWAKAHGKPFYTEAMNPWRRTHLSNLVKAFDFSNPDYSKVELEHVPTASKDPITGQYNGAWVCQLRFRNKVQPKAPYGKQNAKEALWVESGYKPTRGDLSEGRYLVFEAHGHALSHAKDHLGASKAKKHHNGDDQLFVIHWQGTDPSDNRFKVSTASEQPRYLTSSLKFTQSKSKGAEFAFEDLGNGKGYTITEKKSQRNVVLGKDGKVSHGHGTFKVYSVTK